MTITTNADKDLKLSPADRAKAEQIERNVNIVEEATAEAKKYGGDNFKYYTSEEEFNARTESGEHANPLHLTPEQIKEAGQAFAAEDKPSLKPVGKVNNPNAPMGFQWILLDSHQAALEEGRYCPNCLQLQRDRNNGQCNWQQSDSPTAGCGWNRHFDTYTGATI